MIKKRHLIYIILTFSIAFSTTFFIIKSNDHKECGTVIKKVIKKVIDKNGQEVATTEHVCQEKYSF
jgi:hypothetical protein